MKIGFLHLNLRLHTKTSHGKINRETAALHHNVQDGCLDSSVKFLSRLVRTNGFKRCVGIALFEDSEGILVADSRILLVNLLDFLVVSRRCRFDVIVTATGNYI